MIEIHPLVITSACDSSTRIKLGGTKLGEDAFIIGLLFGVQDGQKVSLVDCADVSIEKNTTLGEAEVTKKVKLWTEVFPQNKLVGWYTVDSSTTSEHVSTHHIVAQQCANSAQALFLRFEDTLPDNTSETVPLTLYKADLVNEQRVFVEVDYKVVSSLVENIAIEEIMQAPVLSDKSSLELHNEKLQVSVQILERKIDTMIGALQRIQTENKPDDAIHQELLRLAAKICNRLQSLQCSSVQDSLLLSSLTAKVATLLAAATTGTHILQAVGEVTVSLQDERGHGK